jgi:putative transposase
MPRKPRVEFEGAVYHVMCRGDHREPIVQDDVDRAEFVRCLGDACGKTEWQVHAYVLLGNHYHILWETPKANLVAGMHWFQGTYTVRYNRRQRLHGHLFPGRYKPLLIEPEEDGYFLQVSTYIHLNPVRAGIVDPLRCPLESYAGSSFPAYLAPALRPPWLRLDRVLGALTLLDSPSGRRAYAEQVMERARQALAPTEGREPRRQWEAIRRGWCLGSEGFHTWMKARRDGVIEPNISAS